MKCLTYLLFLVVSLSNAQIVQTDRPEILPLLVEFRNESRKRNLYTIDGAIAKHLGSVETVDAKVMERLRRDSVCTPSIPIGLTKRKVVRGLYGYAFIQPVIYLQDIVYHYPHALRIVLFHELGHFLGLHHSDGIMNEKIDLHKTYTEKEWDFMLDAFMGKLKVLPPDSHWKKHDNTFE